MKNGKVLVLLCVLFSFQLLSTVRADSTVGGSPAPVVSPSQQLLVAAAALDVIGVAQAIKAEANPNTKNDAGQTPLQLAMMQDMRHDRFAQGAIIVLLIGAEANPDTKDSNGCSAIYYAASCGLPIEWMEFLHRQQANFLTEDSGERTVLHAAVLGRHVEQVCYLLQLYGKTLACQADSNGWFPIHYVFPGEARQAKEEIAIYEVLKEYDCSR